MEKSSQILIQPEEGGTYMFTITGSDGEVLTEGFGYESDVDIVAYLHDLKNALNEATVTTTN